MIIMIVITVITTVVMLLITMIVMMMTQVEAEEDLGNEIMESASKEVEIFLKRALKWTSNGLQIVLKCLQILF